MRPMDHHIPIDSDAHLAAIIRKAGLRVTATRLAVLRSLRRFPHADAESVINDVREQLGSVSPQTAYSVLSTFLEAGIVRRIEPAGSPALHELRVGDNHHHIVCRRCGTTTDVECEVGAPPCLNPSDLHGYLLDEAEVTFWGICPECQGDSQEIFEASRNGLKP